MLIGQNPESFLEAGRNGTFPAHLRAASAWADGASMAADWDGKVDTSENPFTDPVQASAWLRGAEEDRDIHGDVYWSACPYLDTIPGSVTPAASPSLSETPKEMP